MLPYVIVTKIACFYFFDLYRGMWRYTSISDLLNIIKAATASSLLITLFIAFKMRFIGYSRSVFFIDWFLTILFIAGFRLVVRFFFESLTREKSDKSMPQQFMSLSKRYPKNAKKLLIIGAGDCGEKIFREIHNNSSLPYLKVSVFWTTTATRLAGRSTECLFSVLSAKFGAAIKKVKADEALIAIPSATG